MCVCVCNCGSKSLGDNISVSYSFSILPAQEYTYSIQYIFICIYIFMPSFCACACASFSQMMREMMQSETSHTLLNQMHLWLRCNLQIIQITFSKFYHLFWFRCQGVNSYQCIPLVIVHSSGTATW